MQKNDIVKNGIHKDFLTLKKQMFLDGMNSNDKELYLKYFDRETIDNCFRIYNAIKKRKAYNLEEILKWCFARKYIKKYRKYKIIFGTLTFSDETLGKTSKETRRRLVARYLKSDKNVVHYIANIDFGDENGREHYHFLAFTKDKIETKWGRGICYFKELKQTKKDIKATTKYILKLNNHCFKESTKLERLIRDRQKENILDKEIKLLYNKRFKDFRVIEFDMKV